VLQALSYVLQAENVTEAARGLALAAALAQSSAVAKVLAKDDSLDIVARFLKSRAPAHFLYTAARLFVAIAPFLRLEGDDTPIREAVAAVVDAATTHQDQPRLVTLAIHGIALLPRSNEWEALINEAGLPALSEFVANKFAQDQAIKEIHPLIEARVRKQAQ
jgi:hypothetical protein